MSDCSAYYKRQVKLLRLRHWQCGRCFCIAAARTNTSAAAGGAARNPRRDFASCSRYRVIQLCSANQTDT